ncbi:hypothetical protein [Pseudomonas sp. HY7a-MNA-CIBAN-0227]|uniref:hypothetical protein n=1 Tax=Pseudomonas sp. HY7a-MNA-CIBAN-0227 TaxID=3140474 RepID=UPI00333015FB
MIGFITTAAALLWQSTTTLAQKVTSDEFVSEIKMVKKSLLALSTTYEITTEDDVIIKYAALPTGTSSGNSNTLPALMKKTNVYNRELIYCPFGAQVSSDFNRVINGGTGVTYDIETLSLTKNARTLDYVAGTAENNFSKNGILGVIISPSYLAKAPLNCNELIYSNETQGFTIDGGRVETITALEIEAVNL